jgi:hypothetical protein
MQALNWWTRIALECTCRTKSTTPTTITSSNNSNSSNDGVRCDPFDPSPLSHAQNVARFPSLAAFVSLPAPCFVLVISTPPRIDVQPQGHEEDAEAVDVWSTGRGEVALVRRRFHWWQQQQPSRMHLALLPEVTCQRHSSKIQPKLTIVCLSLCLSYEEDMFLPPCSGRQWSKELLSLALWSMVGDIGLLNR